MNDASESNTDLSGRLLVASPDLLDPNFSESLVFLADHDANGALGLIVNRPIGKRLCDIMSVEELPDLLCDVPLFFGGPVAGNQVLLALFELSAEGCVCNCRLNPDAQMILHGVNTSNCRLRAFVGYSGWTSGQLECELNRNDWTIDSPEAALFDDRIGPKLWPLYIRGDQRWKNLTPYLPQEPGRN